MSRLPSLSALKFIKIAKKQGFIHHRTSGSHYIFIRYSDQKRLSIPVHKGRDLGRGLLLTLINDMGLTVDEFLKFL